MCVLGRKKEKRMSGDYEGGNFVYGERKMREMCDSGGGGV